MRITPVALLLLNMDQKMDKGMGYIPQEEDYRRLKEMSGEDFPISDYAWYDWFFKHHSGEFIFCPWPERWIYLIKALLYRWTKPLRRK